MYGDPKVHVQRNIVRGEDEVLLLFENKQHFEQWQQTLVNRGIEIGKRDALKPLQESARQLFKDVFGKEI